MHIVFDAQTMLFMDVVLGFCLSIALSFSIHDRFVCPGAKAWVTALFSSTAGLLFLWLRLFVPLWISVAFGNGLILIAHALLWLGFRQYTNRHTPKDNLVLLTPVVVSMVLLWLTNIDPNNITLRSNIAAYTLICLIIMTIFEALKNRKVIETGRLLCAISLSFTIACTLFRALTIQKFAGNVSLFENNLNSLILMVSSGISLVGTGISVMLISSQWLQQRLYMHATYDALTGLYNRYALTELSETGSITKNASSRWSIAIIDIDHFKRVNDQYGHPAGDDVLREIASILKAHVRHRDIVTRYGGEEFVVVLIDCDLQQTRNWAERIRAQIESREIRIQGHSIHVTVSIGIATSSDSELDPAINAADSALYLAKRSGRNQVHVCTEESCVGMNGSISLKN
ncbi:GGDEF domain-containing protein [Tolumonas osonensis]|uniref:diguanylate cyclase n=1 Tax=Tolumonas osonensis TaxID=675874 RepID=A0A841GM50_9GAMM|nr:diguanylate cyclase [Tolumonas osonensis]MBB6055850.1 diguanylate cyclase (GGDEF)-like protein [Tolumonas osonensis]